LDLLKVNLDFDSITVIINWMALVIGTILVFLIQWIARKKYNPFQNWNQESISISVGSTSVTLKPDHTTVRLAHSAWAELATRKAAIPFDEENDVIHEVYNSWYELFGQLRRILRNVQGEQVRKSENTRQLVKVLVVLLNKPLRTHLTKHQARYRRWWDENSKENPKSPQEIQRDYPEYSALIANMEEVQETLIDLTAKLKRIAHGKDEDDAT
jgi:hypothetical protein